MLRPQVLFLVATLAVGCGVPRERTTWKESDPELFEFGPYIIAGEPGDAHIAAKIDVDEPPMLEYWLQSETEQIAAGTAYKIRVRTKKRRDLWTAVLRKLPVGHPISYQITTTKGDSKVHTFRAGVAPGEPIRFAAFGDTRDGHGVHRAVVEAVANEKVDLLLNTGDMVAQGGRQGDWDQFFQIERPLLAETPVMPAVGNHDMGNGQLFRHYFLHDHWSQDRRYYSHDWGNLRILALDSGIECRGGCTQYYFAERVLAEGARKGMVMVLFMHHPPFSSGEHGSDKRVQRPIRELARRHGVELVITGHDHNYERTKPIDGTTYVVAGSAGAPIRAVEPQVWSAHTRTEPHYVIADVQNNVISLRAINADGIVFDTAVIPPLGPTPD